MDSQKKYTGYGYHGGGRKATGTKRVCFQVSCQPNEREEIKRLAEKYDMAISEFVLESIEFYEKSH